MLPQGAAVRGICLFLVQHSGPWAASEPRRASTDPRPTATPHEPDDRNGGIRPLLPHLGVECTRRKGRHTGRTRCRPPPGRVCSTPRSTIR